MIKDEIKPGIIYTEVSSDNNISNDNIKRGIIRYKAITNDIVENVKPYYYVSDTGIVESNFRNKKREMKPAKNPDGYERLELARIDSKPTYVSVHTLVAKAFIPNDNPERNQVNHINGIKDNNDYSNLEWVTSQENINHAIVMNLSKRDRLLNDNQVIFISDCLVNGLSDNDIYKNFKQNYPEISFSFNQMRSLINLIKSKRNYKELTKDYIFPDRSKNKRLLSDEQVIFISDCLIDRLGVTDIFSLFKQNYPEMEISFKQMEKLVSGIRCKIIYKDLTKEYEFPNKD